ncbi:MAG: CYTH domain-containing protein, partial [Candidatus Nanohaloarchaea archaeon]|nr:CYTH domain-containing protein [Candidatus Nanohaloarchaea archaeon]
MEEIEAKVLEIDSDRVRSRLEEQGAELVYDGEVCSRFYDFPDRRLWDEKGAYIRIREMEDHAFVTAKVDQSREGSKTMKEYEFDVGDPKAVATVLEL